jgi:hypothetical protein
LNEILKAREQNCNDNYSLKIIDHNVVAIEFEFTDKNESILLEKNDYKLLNINCEINNENNINNINNEDK